MSSKQRYSKLIRFGVYLAVIVLINIAGLTLYARFDLTKSKAFSISEASKQVVSTLSEPLTINVFFTKDLPPPHNNTERYLRDLLEEFALYSNQYFNFRFYNVSSDAGGTAANGQQNQQLAQGYGIHPVQIQVFEQDEVKFMRAYMGMALVHGDTVEKIPTITTVSGLEYKITTAIQKLNNKVSAFLRLKDKIQVTLYLSSSLKSVAPIIGLDHLADYPKEIERVVTTLNKSAYDRLQFKYVDPSDDEARALQEQYDLMHLKWPDQTKAGLKAGSGIIGLVMRYGDKSRTMPLMEVIRLPIFGTQYQLVGLDQVEEIINANLETLININTDIGYLASHGTLNMASAPQGPMGGQGQESLTSFNALLSENYSVNQIDLAKDDIPDSLKCLIIARPTEKFSEYELYQIDQALMRGTSLALFLDAFKMEMPGQPQMMGLNQGPSHVPIDTGLKKLLAHYGVTVKPAYVLDENSHRQRMPREMGGGERPIYFAPIIKAENINQELPFLSNIKGLITVKISPAIVDQERIKTLKLIATELFGSSEKSWLMEAPINLNPIMLSPPPKEEMAAQPLSYMIEGAFPSYFAGKPIPEKQTKEDLKEPGDTPQAPAPKAAENDAAAKADADAVKDKPAVDMSKIESKSTVVDKGVPARIFLLTSSEMLQDNVLDPAGTSPNDMFIMNVIDVLNDRGSIAEMRSKVQRFNPLDDVSAPAKTLIKIINIAGLPVLVIVCGLLVWLHRVSRRKRIEGLFKP